MIGVDPGEMETKGGFWMYVQNGKEKAALRDE